MQQIEKKNKKFKIQETDTRNPEATSKASLSVQQLSVAQESALRAFLAQAPNHIRLAANEMLVRYQLNSSAISKRALLQLLVRDLVHPCKPMNVLQKLIAAYPDTPAMVLEELRACGHIDVLLRIAEHQNASEDTLNELACAPDTEVRAAVADNCNASVTTQWQLCFDPSADVRFHQAENSNTQLRILMHHLSDENPYVARRARATLQRITGTLRRQAS
ncbi:MAG: hypothetical protein K2W95_27380 [Candidatus Obscuribacterales bacterium]|nr:hypothetical protein [Candidatus Obscuribacterales bacterium]